MYSSVQPPLLIIELTTSNHDKALIIEICAASKCIKERLMDETLLLSKGTVSIYVQRNNGQQPSFKSMILWVSTLLLLVSKSRYLSILKSDNVNEKSEDQQSLKNGRFTFEWQVVSPFPFFKLKLFLHHMQISVLHTNKAWAGALETKSYRQQQ